MAYPRMLISVGMVVRSRGFLLSIEEVVPVHTKERCELPGDINRYATASALDHRQKLLLHTARGRQLGLLHAAGLAHLANVDHLITSKNQDTRFVYNLIIHKTCIDVNSKIHKNFIY